MAVLALRSSGMIRPGKRGHASKYLNDSHRTATLDKTALPYWLVNFYTIESACPLMGCTPTAFATEEDHGPRNC